MDHKEQSDLITVAQRMQREWNERAREDAHFYVAFGRREQDNEEFFATAQEVVRGLERELRRLPAGTKPRARRALEIGCGPGRLMKPMSRHFGEIHGIDVSDEMIARARTNLREIRHAHPHHTSGADLAPFADESFDFVYSYAVFQHIPSRDVVMQYLLEAHRVLKPDGILRVQINGLDATTRTYDTWSGIRISAGEIRQFAREHDMQLLALEGARTQYMWITMRKRDPGWIPSAIQGKTRVRRITNAHSSEPVAPTSGRFASITLWLENVPFDVDLNHLDPRIDGRFAMPVYIGPPESDGLQQINVMMPALDRTGLLPLSLGWRGELLSEPRHFRVIPPGPLVPFVLSVCDGVNMLSGTRIMSRSVKVTVEETNSPERLVASLDDDDIPVSNIDIFCADPLPPRYEINVQLPENVGLGHHRLTLRMGRRSLGVWDIEVA